ncbi:MAG: hypothetical protein ACK4ND_16430 [Cytophagaceae bacterium]
MRVYAPISDYYEFMAKMKKEEKAKKEKQINDRSRQQQNLQAQK